MGTYSRSGTTLNGTVGAIYDAALQPELWPAALTRIADLLDTAWSPLGVIRKGGKTDLIMQQDGGDAGHLAFFNENFATSDVNPCLPLLASGGPGHVVLNDRDMQQDTWQRSALYREVFKPMNYYHGASAYVLENDTHMAVLGLCRPVRRGAYSSREVALLRETMPHLARALEMYLRFAELESFKAANESMWDSLACGVVLLDRQGKLAWANRTAVEILSIGDGLGIENGRLAAVMRQENAAMQTLIDRTLGTSLGRSTGPGGTLRISRPPPIRPLTVLISPLTLRAAFVQRPAIAIFINDPEQQDSADPELLKSLYGLTAREAALADLLAQGVELRDAAERLGVTLHTARTQLKLIFDKTNTHRQAELLHLLLRGPVGTVTRKGWS